MSVCTAVWGGAHVWALKDDDANDAVMTIAAGRLFQSVSNDNRPPLGSQDGYSGSHCSWK